MKFFCPDCGKAVAARNTRKLTMRGYVRNSTRDDYKIELVVLNGATLKHQKGMAPIVVCACGSYTVIIKGSIE